MVRYTTLVGTCAHVHVYYNASSFKEPHEMQTLHTHSALVHMYIMCVYLVVDVQASDAD